MEENPLRFKGSEKLLQSWRHDWQSVTFSNPPSITIPSQLASTKKWQSNSHACGC
jgi:hypothetical protein